MVLGIPVTRCYGSLVNLPIVYDAKRSTFSVRSSSILLKAYEKLKACKKDQPDFCAHSIET